MIKNLRRSVAECGKIKIGGLGETRQGRSGPYRLPQKHDSFTICKAQREGGAPDGDLVVDTAIMTALVEQGYADSDGKIRKLPIMVHSDRIDEVFPTAYVAYSGKTCACRGDGETATRYEIVDKIRTGESKQIKCPCELLEPDPDTGARRCKFNGVLHCSLRLPGFAVIGSVLRWRTTSRISCEQMVGHLETILFAVGVLRGLPLALVVRPVQVNPPGGRPSTVFVCHVDLCEQIAIAQRAALEAAQMRRDLAGGQLEALEARYQATLQLPGTEDEQEQAEIAREYYPEVVGTTPAGAEVQTGAALPPAALDAPLASLLPPTGGAKPDPVDVAYRDAEEWGAPKAQSAAPPPAQQEQKPARRTRRTRCKACGELAEGVKLGLCPACVASSNQAAAPPPAAQPPPPAAPPVAPVPPTRPASATTAPPAQTPYKRIQAAARAASSRGATQETIHAALLSAWPDCDRRRPEDWSDQDADHADGILAGLPQ